MAARRSTAAYLPSSDASDLNDPTSAELDFLQHLHRHRCRGVGSPDREKEIYFYPLSSIKTYFDDKIRVQRLLRGLARLGEIPVAYHIVNSNYQRILSILITLSKGHFIQFFTKHVSLSDRYLPFTKEPEHFPHIDGPVRFFENFKAAQWPFCAVNLDHTFDVELEDDEILPFVEVEQWRSGGSSNISRIKIHSEYDFLRPGERADDPQAHVYALKTYKSNGGHGLIHYENETKAFARLSERNLSDSHIIDFYEGFRHKGTYNIIMEFAPKGTLEEFFQQNKPPEGEEYITQFWKSLLIGLSAALLKLHEDETCFGWHQDIKPSNILVTGLSLESPSGLMFKLADFGLSSFMPAIPSDINQRAVSKDSLGASDYGAPECARIDEFTNNSSYMVTQLVDVWSLGCIFSEAATWIHSSLDGLNAFRELRYRTTKPMEQVTAKYAFHDTWNILEVVQKHHRKVVRKAYRKNDRIVSTLLQQLVPEMLQSSPDSRPRAYHVYKTAKCIISEAEKGSESSDDSQDHFNGARRVSSLSQIPSRAPKAYPRRVSTAMIVPPLDTAIAQPLPLPDMNHTVSTPEPQDRNLMDNNFPREPLVQTRNTDGNRDQHRHVDAYMSQLTLQKNGSENGVQESDHKRGDSGTGQSTSEGIQRQSSPQSAAPGVLSPLLSHQNSQPGTPNTPTRFTPMIKPAQAHDWVVKRNRKMAQYSCGTNLHDLGLKDLHERDHVFLLDDSDTMEPYWSNLKYLCRILFTIVKDYDQDGVDFYFTVSERNKKYKKRTKSVKTMQAFNAMLEERSPQAGPCNINQELGNILEAYQKKCRSRNNTTLFNRLRGKVKPISVYILTDGRWDLGSDPTNVIQTQVDQMTKLGIGKQKVGLQFINWGDDPQIQSRLDRLDSNLGTKLDIVDTERANGNVLKMLLGPIHELFDGDGSTP